MGAIRCMMPWIGRRGPSVGARAIGFISRSRRHGSSESTISTRCPRVVRHTSHDAPPCALGHPATLPDARWGRPRPSTDHAASLVRSGSRPACSADARARTGAGQRHAAEQTARATHVTLQRDVTVLKAFRCHELRKSPAVRAPVHGPPAAALSGSPACSRAKRKKLSDAGPGRRRRPARAAWHPPPAGPGGARAVPLRLRYSSYIFPSSGATQDCRARGALAARRPR